MCGRFISGADDLSWDEYCDILRLPTSTPAPARAEQAPGQAIAAVRAAPDSRRRELVQLHWGLLPHWVTDRKEATKLINVRAETAAQKFARYLEQHRCIIPAAGFFEWQEAGPGQAKLKLLFRDPDHPVLSLAGLWSRWVEEGGPEEEAVETCAILTTEPSEVMRPVHDRMPVILPAAAANLWLDPGQPVRDLAALLVPYDSLVAEPANTPPPAQGSLF